jgi:osmotically inducible protein OsmC
MADRSANAVWEGSLADGTGEVTFDSGALGPAQVSWPARIEEPGGRTSPEELIAAAHASCFSMALAGQLGRRGRTPQRLETTATVTIEKGEAGASITRSAIRVRATVPDIEASVFEEAAQAAKEGCPVSMSLAGNVEVTLDAQLV